MTNGDKLNVQPAVVKSMGGDLQSSVTTFTSSADTFDTAMNSLLSVAKGEGRDSIERITNEWIRAHGQVTKALEQLGLRTEDAGNQYDQGRQDQREQVRATGNQMDFHVENI